MVAMVDVLEIRNTDIPYLPADTVCSYELLTGTSGLSLMSGSARFSTSGEWINQEGRGISLGLVLKGRIAMDVGAHESDYLAELDSFIWAEPSTVPMRHVVPEAQELQTIFLTVPESMRNTYDLLDAACGMAVGSPQKKGGISNFHKTPLNAHGLSIAREIAECAHVGPLRALYLEAKSIELLIALLQLLQGVDAPGLRGICPRGSNAERLMEARRILITEFQFPPSLDELAGRIGMCTSAMTAGFRRMFGTTIVEFVQERRLNHAFMALRDGHMTVSQAAYSAGYSRAYFSTLFRHRFGQTPGDVSRRK